MTPITYLRPHHGLCICLFQKDGKETPYTKVMRQLTTYVETEKNKPLLWNRNFDPMCSICPHRDGNICHKKDEVDRSDKICLELCGIKINDRVPWEQMQNLLIKNILEPAKLEYTCHGCEYLSRCEQIRKLQWKAN